MRLDPDPGSASVWFWRMDDGGGSIDHYLRVVPRTFVGPDDDGWLTLFDLLLMNVDYRFHCRPLLPMSGERYVLKDEFTFEDERFYVEPQVSLP